MAINWRNVDAPSFGASNLLLQSGANRIGESINQLRSLAEQQGQNVQNQLDQEKTENTDAMLDDIYSLRSMDDYNQALESGQFDADKLRSQNVDVNKIRSALLQQDNNIMDEETTLFNYEKTLQQRKDNPIIDSFTADLYQSNSTASIDNLLESIDNLGLSEEGKVAAIRTANERKQSLLDEAYQNKVRGRDDWRFGREVKAAQLTDRENHIREYNPLKTRINSEGKEETYYPKLEMEASFNEVNAKLEGLRSKYFIPENYDEVIASGTAADAVNSFVSGLDNEDIDVVDVNSALFNALKSEPFKATVAVGGEKVEKEYTYNSLPKWVVEQSLKEVQLEDGFIFRGSMSDKQLKDFKDAVNKNLRTYSTITTNAASMALEQKHLESERIKLQRDQLLFIDEAKSDFYKKQNKPRSM